MHSIKNNNQILHGDQTTHEENSTTNARFAVAYLLVINCCSLYMRRLESGNIIAIVVVEFEPLSANIVALFHGSSQVDTISSEMGQCGMLLDRTQFYSESGGQISDQGALFTHEVCFVFILAVPPVGSGVVRIDLIPYRVFWLDAVKGN